MKKVRILYIEDELFLARIVRDTLESQGYDVFWEADGAKALSCFDMTQPDVCLLDIMLPNRDGFEIADSIRERNTEVPIIFLSARSEAADVVNGFRMGANDYIRKPFSMEELMVRIENVLRVPSDNEDRQHISLGDYVFNPKRQTLHHPAEPRKLSYRESELLRLLCQHGHDVLERREILNLLWGSDSFFNSRNLDVYITKIRSYLKHDPRIEIITIKGIGYRFVMG